MWVYVWFVYWIISLMDWKIGKVVRWIVIVGSIVGLVNFIFFCIVVVMVVW